MFNSIWLCNVRTSVFMRGKQTSTSWVDSEQINTPVLLTPPPGGGGAAGCAPLQKRLGYKTNDRVCGEGVSLWTFLFVKQKKNPVELFGEKVVKVSALRVCHCFFSLCKNTRILGVFCSLLDHIRQIICGFLKDLYKNEL